MPEPKKNSEPYILFKLKDTSYAIPSDLVQQMEMVETFTPVPNAPPFLEGLVFIRGRVIPAINLRARFGFPRIPYDLKTRLVVVRSDQRSVGLIVDVAREFMSIDKEDIQPPPERVTGLSGKYLKGIAGVGERLILILDVDEILSMTADMVEN